MSTFTSGTFRINGVVSTNKTITQNINDLCTACGAWATYDIADGKWSVVINRTGNSVASFDDSNIIGGINISGTGINELYNAATIEFPHKDLRDQTDYIDLEVPEADRFPNELDNVLNIRTDLMNDPVQAQYLATIELKQSRVDKVIQFRTDYSKIGLKAGDIIDVTNTVLGYNDKKFRITKVEEDDSDVLTVSITALEYDANIYNSDGLVRKIREKKTGIIPKSQNQALTAQDNEATARSVSQTFRAIASTTAVKNAYNAYTGDTPFGGVNGAFAGDMASVVNLTFNLTRSYASLTLYCETPLGTFDYQYKVNGSIQNRTGFYGFLPTQYSLIKNGETISTITADWQTQNAIFPLVNLEAGLYTVRIEPLPTYDLSQESIGQIFPKNYEVQEQNSGGGFTVTGIAIL